MSIALETFPETGREPGIDVPFYSTDQLGGVEMACAAMILGSLEGPSKHHADSQFLQAFTGIRPGSSPATTSARMLLSMHQRSLDVDVVGNLDLAGFAEHGYSALPEVFVDGFWRRFRLGGLATEQASAGLLVDTLRSQDRYEKAPVTVDNIKNAVSQGWVVRLTFNGEAVQGREGYSPRSLIVTDVKDDVVVAHNPGGNGTDAAAHQELEPYDLQEILSDPTFVMQAVGSASRIRRGVEGVILPK